MDHGTMSNVLDITRSGSHTAVTLNRPDKANALAAPLVAALQNAIDTAKSDGTTTFTLQGNGSNFCGGFDLSALDAESDETLIPRLLDLERMLQSIYYAPFATIALIHGGAFGAGFDLATACDYRLATPDARFRMPGWRMGLALGTRRTAQRVGAERAFVFLRDALTINAETALQQQFVTELADPVTWPRRVEQIAAVNARLPAKAYAQLKRLLQTDTAEADMRDLHASLIATPLKPRMQKYVATDRQKRE
jgi:enoyl-CoA hydratase/carnithine racemase